MGFDRHNGILISFSHEVRQTQRHFNVFFPSIRGDNNQILNADSGWVQILFE